MPLPHELTIELSPTIIEELKAIVQHLDIDSPETLVKTYLREVIIAARIEQATSQTRQEIINRSSDLDMLKLKIKNKDKRLVKPPKNGLK